MVNLAPGIVVDSSVRFGKPLIEGTRLTVHEVLGALAGGMASEEIEREYDLSSAQIQAVLRYAASFLSEEMIDTRSLKQAA